MKKLIIFIALCAAFILVSCGVKKRIPEGKIVAYAIDARSSIGLLWQNACLQITLNQGRQLQYYRVKSDTLYLYEAARDTTDFSTRKYTLNIPTHELLIIKYNDSLVYPIMHAEDICEYPLTIKSMSVQALKEYLKEQENANKQSINPPMLSPNLDKFPLELHAGTYLHNAGLCKFGRECDCLVDSTQKFVLNVDGSWQQYNNGALINCGIMRKIKHSVYEMQNYRKEDVFFLDTTAISGQIIGLKEDKRRWQENIPYFPNEYYCVGKRVVTLLKLFPCREDEKMRFFFDSGKNFMLEGSACGWKQVNNKY